MAYYGTAEGFRDYHTARGRDVSAYDDDAAVAVKLLVASEFFDGAFRDRFYGEKVAQLTQVREWPRTGVINYYGYGVPSTSVPVEVENATYEIAYRDSATLNKDFVPNKYKRVSIDGALSVEFNMLDAAAIQTQMPILSQILQPLLGIRGGSVMGLSSGMVRV